MSKSVSVSAYKFCVLKRLKKTSLNNPEHHPGDQCTPEEVLQDRTGRSFQLHSTYMYFAVLPLG